MKRLFGAIVAGVFVAVALRIAPDLAAGGLLYPTRHTAMVATPANCTDRDFQGDGVMLRGWACRAGGQRRGAIVYLHGIADNRSSSVGAIQRFTAKGFDVVAYDSRRHGASQGDVCTYGFYEKRDLRRVIDTLEAQPIVLIGTSLGAAVAVQEAAADERVKAIVVAEIFSDLRTVASERAPWFLPRSVVQKAFAIAEERAKFQVDAVSPMEAARSVRVPVLLIHGAEDSDTPPAHSQRVHDALAGPKRLILVPGAGHNHSLSDPGTWAEVERWVESAVG